MQRQIDWNKYVRQPDGSYMCRDCGSDIKEGKIARPIHTRKIPGAGRGEVHYCIVPYCPKCEPNASWEQGPPLYYGDDHICPHPPDEPEARDVA